MATTIGSKLEIKGLNKTYRSGHELHVINNLNLTVSASEFLSIVGVSGSGKSTLLRLIAGFETADAGEIYLNRAKINRPSLKRVMIFQDFNQLFPWKTVLENVVFPLKIHNIGGSKADQYERGLNYLKLVKLTGFENYYPHQLSGGMKQKAAIARALAMEPDLLLMDEPFSSLDAQTRSMLQENLLEIWKNTGVTILFVTHDIGEAILLSDRVAVIDPQTRKIARIIDNELPRPRKVDDPQVLKMTTTIYEELRTNT